MFKYRRILQTTTCPKWRDPIRLLANGFQFFCRYSAVLIFPTLTGDCKDPIQNREGLQIAHTTSIHLL